MVLGFKTHEHLESCLLGPKLGVELTRADVEILLLRREIGLSAEVLWWRSDGLGEHSHLVVY